jgi:hypothetical protein
VAAEPAVAAALAFRDDARQPAPESPAARRTVATVSSRKNRLSLVPNLIMPLSAWTSF